MAERKLKGIVRYDNVDSAYFQRRQLRRGAGWQLLWGLGISAVISGLISGWNTGLSAAGFWGLAIATGLMATMYMVMVYSLAEMSAALPNAGGFYAFTRSAFGAFAGYICGIAELIEYIIINAVGFSAFSQILKPVFPAMPDLGWTVIFLTLFTFILIQGKEIGFKVMLCLAIASVVILLIFLMGAATKFNPSLLFNIPADPEQAMSWLPKGVGGILGALPYAIWWFLAIEIVPLAAEETQDPARDIPKAMLRGMYVLIPLSLLILIFNTGLPIMGEEGISGAAAVAVSDKPFNEGLIAVFGSGIFGQIMLFSVIFILFAGYPACIYAASRLFFALSRAGFFPRWISVTNGSGMPARAAILSSSITLVLIIVFTLFAKDNQTVETAFINMCVASAVISYGLVMCSYIKLKISRPSLPRPYVSPVGIPGAMVGVALSVIAFISCFSNPEYRLSVYLVVAVLVLAASYFWIYSRNQLVANTDEMAIAEEIA